jgi:signal transduction histidine kinase
MSPTTFPPSYALRRIGISAGSLFAFLLALAFVLMIYVWRIKTQSVASISGIPFAAQLLPAVAASSVALLLGTLLLLRRERAERLRMQAALQKQSAELWTQTATAHSLAHDVETARAQLQKFNDILEERIEERTADLKISTKALGEEMIERKQAGVFLRESESNLIIAHDELERGLADHTEELERSNRELEQFAYVASHDLQEPLRAISGCVQILQKRYAAHLDARGHELVAHTVDGVARLQELIAALLAYSRVGRDGSEPEPISSRAALSTALQQLESAIQETGAVIVEPTELPIVCGNHIQLVQLLQNVIGNAIKYRSVATPRVEISALRRGEVWVFAISDNGIGIEAQYFQRVFSIFQRLHTRDEYPGTGIGLAICRRIVEQAGGSMWIESELGKGSTFYFTLLGPSVESGPTLPSPALVQRTASPAEISLGV